METQKEEATWRKHFLSAFHQVTTQDSVDNKAQRFKSVNLEYQKSSCNRQEG